MRIRLTGPEMTMAGLTGVCRFVESREKGRVPGTRTMLEAAGGDILGAMGEAAVAKALGRYWLGEWLNHKAMDVPGYQVRHTSYDSGHLCVQDSDADGERFVLVVGDPPNLRVVGWMWGGEAKQLKYYSQTFGCFVVPQADLRVVEELRNGHESVDRGVAQCCAE